MIVSNSTLSVNSASSSSFGASGGYGGAIFNSGTLTVSGSTLSGNIAERLRRRRRRHWQHRYTDGQRQHRLWEHCPLMPTAAAPFYTLRNADGQRQHPLRQHLPLRRRRHLELQLRNADDQRQQPLWEHLRPLRAAAVPSASPAAQ